MKNFLITRLHLSETYHKQAVNNRKFFYSLGVFCSFSKYIEYLKYSIFHYLGYSCVILPGSPHVFADILLALTYSILNNFAFNFLSTTPFSDLVLSANSSLFWLVDIFFQESYQNWRRQKKSLFGQEFRFISVSWPGKWCSKKFGNNKKNCHTCILFFILLIFRYPFLNLEF